MATGGMLTMREAATRLGVHYMTVYRYVRTGRLLARQEGSRWLIPVEALEGARHQRRPGPVRGGSRRVPAATVSRLAARLVAGDEPGAYEVLQRLLAAGASPTSLYLEALCPALTAIGESWAAREITVADEHRASAVAHRLLGRLGPLFLTRGPRAGTVVLASPGGELHSLPVAIVADVLRARRFDVVDLGGDVPADALAATVARLDGVIAVGLAVTWHGNLLSAGIAAGALRAAGVTAPVIIGGAAVGQRRRGRNEADHVTHTIGELLATIDQLQSAAGPGGISSVG